MGGCGQPGWMAQVQCGAPHATGVARLGGIPFLTRDFLCGIHPAKELIGTNGRGAESASAWALQKGPLKLPQLEKGKLKLKSRLVLMGLPVYTKHWLFAVGPVLGSSCDLLQGLFKVGLEKGLVKLAGSWDLAMVLMKPVRKRKGGGNSKPCKRNPFPSLDQEGLTDRLDGYIRRIGMKQSFDLKQYRHLQARQSECPSALFKLNLLLEALLDVSPTAEVKYKYLKKSMEDLCSTWGVELLAAHFDGPRDVVAGAVSDCLTVLMNHWRRATSSEAAWQRFCNKLDNAQAATMTRLYKKTEQKQPTKPTKTLRPHLSEVTLDSEGFPAMLAHSLPSSGSSGEEGDVESEMDSCEAAVQKEDPPPVLKCDWKVAAGKPPTKRPATSKLFKKPSSCKAMGPGDAGMPIHTSSVTIGGGKQQSYIQHVPGPGPSKRLIAAVTLSQASRTSKSHRKLIEMLLPKAKEKNATKELVVNARDALLLKYKKP